MITKRVLVTICAVMIVILLPLTASAAVPQTINYQGYLKDSGGAPASGPVNLTFKLYDVLSGGTALWTETQTGVALTNGVYSVILGSSSPTPVPITLPFDAQYYLGVTVGADPEMTPRQKLTVVPYAFRAKEADGVAAGSITDADISPSAAIQVSKISGLGSLATKSAVGSADITDGTILSADIADGGIYSSDIADNTIAADDILDNSVTAADLLSEPGIDYTSASSAVHILSTCNTTTNLDSVTISAPASGFIYVSASGIFCTYTAAAYTWLMLDNNPAGTAAYDGLNYAYDRRTTARACGIGEFTPYAFHNVYPVTAGTYTYYLHGCVSPVGNQSYLMRQPLIAMYFPTRY